MANSKKEREHYARVAKLRCCICRAAAEVHHLTGLTHRGAARKAHYTETIPLCPPHHRTGGYGVALHAGEEEWEKVFGTQEFWLEHTRTRLKAAESIGFG